MLISTVAEREKMATLTIADLILLLAQVASDIYSHENGEEPIYPQFTWEECQRQYEVIREELERRGIPRTALRKDD